MRRYKYKFGLLRFSYSFDLVSTSFSLNMVRFRRSKYITIDINHNIFMHKLSSNDSIFGSDIILKAARRSLKTGRILPTECRLVIDKTGHITDTAKVGYD